MSGALHRYVMRTRSGGSTSIGARTELDAVLNLVGALADGAEAMNREKQALGQHQVLARDVIANLPVSIEHMASCPCQRPGRTTKAAELYA